MPENPPPSRCELLLLSIEADLLAGMRDRIRWQSTTHGEAVRSELGMWNKHPVVIATPREGYRLVEALKAVHAAHHPRWIIAVGPWITTSKRLLQAIRVLQQGAGAYDLNPQAPFNRKFVDSGDLEAEWAFNLCGAAAEAGLPIDLIAAPVDEALLRDKRRSLARRAGALLGSLWRKPSSAKTWWGQQERRWDVEELLADALEDLLKRL